jgi:uncharacterized membrane protein YfcA
MLSKFVNFPDLGGVLLNRLLILILVGFAAQLVDGSLGMGYGVTTTTLLLMFGISPAIASASAHLAEVVTNAASGVSHIKFKNVDWYLIKTLTIPGAIGAFVGACFLSNLPGDLIKPYVSIFLLFLGIFIFLRFLLYSPSKSPVSPSSQIKKGFLIPLGLISGFFDATGGGGWGPITTPILMSHKGVETRKVIGSVDTSEFVVSSSATIGFLISLGWAQIHWEWVIALMIGGIFAAPIAAWIVRVIPSVLLGVLVGGIIIVTNTRTLLNSFHVSPEWVYPVYIGLFAVWAICVVITILRLRNIQSKKGIESENETESFG